MLTFVACKPQKWQITQATSNKIAIDASMQPLADSAYISYLQPFKQKVDEKMNVVIGRTSQSMRAHAPESLLSNLSADIYLQAASDYLKLPVDIAIVNLGGLRTQIPAGDITLRKVFELMPFENELVILWLRGDKLKNLLDYFASINGEGVAGLQMRIDNGQATDILIGSENLDNQKLYCTATNDYLADGNDNMEPLAAYEKRENTGIKIRDMFLDYIKNETAKGNLIQSKLDGRIRN